MTYFDLVSTRSYKMSGPSTKRYVFVKGKPVEVTDLSDIAKFRMHTDLFFECDKNGNAVMLSNNNATAKSFVKFRPDIVDRDEIIKEANAKAEAERKTVDVNSILEEASKDVVNNFARPLMKTKKEKKVKNVLECDSCGFIAKDQNDLKDHLDKHSEED